MKKILKYTKGKKNTYIVTLDSEEVTLYDDIIVKYELLLKKCIKEEELEFIKKENQALDSYYKAVSFIALKMRTIKETKDFLHKKGYEDSYIQSTVEKLLKERLLDDAYYTKVFLGDAMRLNLDGPDKLKRKLENLGIKEEIYQRYFEEIDEEIWQERILKLATKKNRSAHHESIKAQKQKLMNYLVVNGYSSALSKNVLEKIDFSFDSNILLKEKEKLERKLSRKYSGDSLLFQLKQKLYLKGYSKEEITKVLDT